MLSHAGDDATGATLIRRDVDVDSLLTFHMQLRKHTELSVALHREFSLCMVFIFSKGRKDLYQV
jgi:hypothetical protein